MRAALPVIAAATGPLAFAYAALIERNHFTLRRFDIPVLEPGSRPLRILHLSDLHMIARQRSKQQWLRALDRLDPDLVINTGDNLSAPDGVPAILSALGPLLDRPGAFVMGSNDYFAPRPTNPVRYLRPRKDARRIPGIPLPWLDLRDGMVAAGWHDLTNARATVKADGRLIALAGVDDPHIRRDRYDRIAGAGDTGADLRLAATHSPEPRVLDRFAADGYDLVLAGHTHGGQLRIPLWGAPVTNCGIDRSRARWVSRWGTTYLHVSPGLGTSPYAPVRFACPPEATLLTLSAR